MNGLTDTHIHLTDTPYVDRVSETLEKTVANGVSGIIVPGYSIDSWKTLVDLKKRNPQISTAIGLHPGYITFENVSDYNIQQYYSEMNPIAIGEIGLDNRKGYPSSIIQEKLFGQQLDLACAWQKPLILHCVGEHSSCISLLKQYSKRKPLQGVLHRANCSIQIAEQYIKLGFHLGFGPDLFNSRRKKLHALAQWAPNDNILLETDAPYCKNQDGDIYHPWILPELANYLASLKGISASTMCNIVKQNTYNLFGI